MDDSGKTSELKVNKQSVFVISFNVLMEFNLIFNFQDVDTLQRKHPFDTLTKEDLIKKCKHFLSLAQKAKQAKDGMISALMHFKLLLMYAFSTMNYSIIVVSLQVN